MTGLDPAKELGRISALAIECARDLHRHAAEYPEVFPERPFDAGMYHSLGLVGAFGSPWARAEELRAVNRAGLWVFAVDLRVDHVTASRHKVAALVEECLAVAGGEAPRSPLTQVLAGIRDDVGGDRRWRGQLERMLSAMLTEWDWRESKATPTLEEYLLNADSCGSSFVNLSHWLYTGDAWTLANLPQVREAGDEVQRYLRLLNDLATYDREARWGDANALTMGAGRAEVTRRMAQHERTAAGLISALRGTSPRTALYLERQIGFNTGFYGISDYWGEL
ncbi:terpene synthase [Nonomuraea mesophila]|uniref:Terpene synthase n=1 Tax=Nonomuraea mesophila TaxID=2530382 RepID=A0A4R5EEJ4_9ACTN|nr:terpene synthase family protein [Nonomuraea mesophila]TDE32710.1 terpene synthase [Nonomuraea mesophila]